MTGLGALRYLELLEQQLTALLPLTNCTPARAGLYRLLVTDLRPTIGRLYAELEAMADQLQEDEAVYQQEIRLSGQSSK